MSSDDTPTTNELVDEAHQWLRRHYCMSPSFWTWTSFFGMLLCWSTPYPKSHYKRKYFEIVSSFGFVNLAGYRFVNTFRYDRIREAAETRDANHELHALLHPRPPK